MYHPRFSPGDRVRLRASSTIGTVISTYAVVVRWHEVQLDDQPKPRVFCEDELTPAPAANMPSSALFARTARE
jgi:hypothetical protein